MIASDGDESAPLPTVYDLSNKNLREVPPELRSASVASASAVRELNLAFNRLTSLVGVPEACPRLERLSARGG